MNAFWEVVASNALVVTASALALTLLSRVWKDSRSLHLLWVLVLLKLVTPPLVTLPFSFPVPYDEELSVSTPTQSPDVVSPRTPLSSSSAQHSRVSPMETRQDAGVPLAELGRVTPPSISAFTVLSCIWVIGIVGMTTMLNRHKPIDRATTAYGFRRAKLTSPIAFTLLRRELFDRT